MTSTYRTYHIDHGRIQAQAWRGGFDRSRPADIIGSTLADVMHHIDVVEGCPVCAHCGVVIQPEERSGMTFMGVTCEACRDAGERCAPDPEPEYEPYHYPQP